MKTNYLLIALGFCCLSASLNAQFIQSFDKAYTLGKGKVDAGLSTTFLTNTKSEDSHIYGTSFRWGVGLSKSVDLNFRITAMGIVFNDEVSNPLEEAFIIVSLEPKFSVAKGLAIKLPIDILVDEEIYPAISPQLLYTYRGSSKTFEITPSLQVNNMILKKEDKKFFDDQVLSGVNLSLGAGLSNNLDRWAIRPEGSYQVAGDFKHLFIGGIGFSLYFK